MRLIHDSKVHVLAAPQYFPHPTYILPDGGTDGERLIATGGKVCYDSFGLDGRPIAEHIDNLIKSGHGSVLEHPNYSLLIEGVSRGLSHELVRHRAGFAYSQRSTRYTNENDAWMVLEPEYARLFQKHEQWVPGFIDTWKNFSDESPWSGPDWREIKLVESAVKVFKTCLVHYQESVDHWELLAPEHFTKTERRKYARGKARQLLPHALETRLVVTANLRAWRHFIEARSHHSAESEIRRLCNKIADVLIPFAPLVFKDYFQEYLAGFIEYRPGTRKV
jgi:thymidylate synthase (FAD)